MGTTVNFNFQLKLRYFEGFACITSETISSNPAISFVLSSCTMMSQAVSVDDSVCHDGCPAFQAASQKLIIAPYVEYMRFNSTLTDSLFTQTVTCGSL